ncbi:Spy/CpxP family protein refolding chaperone [Geomobilimonas luticola]|uniref:Periplasmic heavy metal sensor n=1 Tax=Geomobilimonas luticola TaxID=1114878 RepID=A0ABS5S8S4_9BACT|nr:Spy/CpxP family protein refolding chaperone [Geomobilimonas luticola]MBT0651769.1 hypothetical protein [Geomobilimonas luticola]
MKRTVVALFLAVAFAAPAFSQMDAPVKGSGAGWGPMPGMGGMDRMGTMMGMCLTNADKIGLSDEQVAKLTPIHREMQKKQAQFKADLKVAEIELMEIMEVKDFDLEKANAAVKKIADIKTTHHLEMLKSMKEARTILTDAQFQKMKKLMPMKAQKKPARKMKRP